MTGAGIVGVGETRYLRRPPSSLTTHSVIGDAARSAIEDAALVPRQIDGLGVASFTLAPDNAVDLAVRMGLRVRWLMDGRTGGASGIDMLQHAVRAVEAGDAERILLVAGDVFHGADFRRLVDGYNRATSEHLAPIPFGGPNSLFALVTRRHMRAHQLSRADYGRLVVAQRAWAAGNPNAAYRSRLTLDDYLQAEIVADPLCLFDCVPVVSGADAVVVARAREGGAVRVRAVKVGHNLDRHEGDGTVTGLAALAPSLWRDAEAGPGEMDVVSVYDDYPVMVLAQLEDLGFGDPRAVLDAIGSGALAVNTSGGQLSAGQAGAAAGLHGLVEAVTQLRDRALERQVSDAKLALVTGYGMVAYRYGACANAAVLEAPA